MAVLTAGSAFALDFRLLDLAQLLTGNVTVRSSTQLIVDYGGGDRDEFTGVGVTYNQFGEPIGGTITGYRAYSAGSLTADFSGAAASAATFMSFVKNADTVGGVLYMLSGDDQISGSAFADFIADGSGSDTMSGFGGDLVGADPRGRHRNAVGRHAGVSGVGPRGCVQHPQPGAASSGSPD
jgi:hypothetical protein